MVRKSNKVTAVVRKKNDNFHLDSVILGKTLLDSRIRGKMLLTSVSRRGVSKRVGHDRVRQFPPGLHDKEQDVTGLDESSGVCQNALGTIELEFPPGLHDTGQDVTELGESQKCVKRRSTRQSSTVSTWTS